MQDIPGKLYVQVLTETPEQHRHLVIPDNDTDINANAALTLAERGTLKIQRKRLRTLMADKDWKKIETVEILDRVLAMTDRVLNPAAHSGTTPLYQEEVQRALNLIKRLEKCLRIETLTSAPATLPKPP